MEQFEAVISVEVNLALTAVIIGLVCGILIGITLMQQTMVSFL